MDEYASSPPNMAGYASHGLQQEEELYQKFLKISGVDMEADPYELQAILRLLQYGTSEFSIEVCRSMVAMYDGDLSGQLSFYEFNDFWLDLQHWRSIYQQFDRDRSNNLDSQEFSSALSHSGFNVSEKSQRKLFLRFSNKEKKIEFADFIHCTIRLKTMLYAFGAMPKDAHGRAGYTLDNFVLTAMYS